MKYNATFIIMQNDSNISCPTKRPYPTIFPVSEIMVLGLSFTKMRGFVFYNDESGIKLLLFGKSENCSLFY